MIQVELVVRVNGASVVFFKQKTAYEFVDCDWSSDVFSSDLLLKKYKTKIKSLKKKLKKIKKWISL